MTARLFRRPPARADHLVRPPLAGCSHGTFPRAAGGRRRAAPLIDCLGGQHDHHRNARHR